MRIIPCLSYLSLPTMSMPSACNDVTVLSICKLQWQAECTKIPRIMHSLNAQVDKGKHIVNGKLASPRHLQMETIVTRGKVAKHTIPYVLSTIHVPLTV